MTTTDQLGPDLPSLTPYMVTLSRWMADHGDELPTEVAQAIARLALYVTSQAIQEAMRLHLAIIEATGSEPVPE